MTAAEERVLRAAVNPWPLSDGAIARAVDRAGQTTRKHLLTLERHGMVRRYKVDDGRGKATGWMATEAGHGAVQSIDDMRAASR